LVTDGDDATNITGSHMNIYASHTHTHIYTLGTLVNPSRPYSIDAARTSIT